MRCNPSALKSSSTTRHRASAAAGVGLRRRSAASGYGYATTKAGRRALVSTITLSLSLSLFVASSVPARASPSCLSYAEARAAHRNAHLFWHGRAHCWDANGGRTAARKVRQHEPPSAPSSPKSESDKSDKTPMLLYPTLVQGAGIPDAQFLNAISMSSWPLILDVDAVTADAELDTCCWPELETSFRERWASMPAAWFMAGLR
jgi:hypothetical protein